MLLTSLFLSNKTFNLFINLLLLKKKVHIYILEDRSYKFSVFLPTTGYILSFIKKFEIFDKIKKKPVISLKNVIQLCLLKFPKISLLKSFPVILGTVNTCGLTIIF